jgi:hypothetical protein
MELMKSIAKEQAEDQMRIYQTIIDGSVMAANAIKSIGKGGTQVFNLRPPTRSQKTVSDPLDEPYEPSIKEHNEKIFDSLRKEPVVQEKNIEKENQLEAMFKQIKSVQEDLRRERLDKQEAIAAAGEIYSVLDVWRQEIDTVSRNMEITMQQFIDMKSKLYESHMKLYNALKAKE